ncbi:sigma-54-dependent Fis family transcriptional regulator [Geobacter sp. SVR]|uniref:sigma-54 interaction domain-containing protein n=1 Tax=Geobacter sp. SVR TaxID=2495594 RepID=UPI00143EFD21|nr:sigma 54-interacting transcriptional regulator [Geobacter sp. SVR]BCS55063.1 sigma-54-dependent Fis family transcriptional regulator [Geobacter sp. SVR]GCF85245.1 sigma-54-dependent Fis family transcriptional regulator [Geobacter sp. SVR]
MSAAKKIETATEKPGLTVVFSSDVHSASKALRLNLATVGKCRNRECRAKVFPLLYQMSRVIAESADLPPTLIILQKIMEKEMNIVCGMISLYHQKSGRILIHESFGLTEEEEARGIYALGEGITGKVVETGKAIMLPRISEEPAFLHRTRSLKYGLDQELSFICVPIMRGRKVLGAISAERIYDSIRLLEQDVELLSTFAAMIAPAVELYLMEHVDKAMLERENRRLNDALKQRFKPSNIIGSSKAMTEIYELIRKITAARTTVLVLGESGVGKELVAGAIHYNSPLADGPFVKFNCAALPESIIESELFGHEKGAYTGATAHRTGRFEDADGGTIFLDEVGELSLAMQTKLLRVLQEKTFERVGSNRPIKVDIRIIAATNRDLAEMVSRGLFREDLYYRLNVFPITIPPLRDRGSDIITLADHFVARFAGEAGKEVKRISTPALNMLMSYHWPGNVRELENVIERAVILCEDEVVHGYNLPPSLQTSVLTGTVGKGGLEAKLASVEYEMLVEALKTHNGNMTEAARELGMTRRVLGLRMAKFDLEYKTFR